MSQDLDDPINTLLEQILGSKKGYDRDLCVIYLRSTCQKHLFAEKRLTSLKKRIAEYKKRITVKQYDTFTVTNLPVTLYIEMEFDHCVSSLRSSLEHLAQLINAIVPLNLPSKSTSPEKRVTLKNVIGQIRKSDLLKNNECLSNLLSYLESEMEKDWYKDLHELRITMFHDRFDRLVRVSTQTLKRQLLDLKFLLPPETAKSLVTEEERNIVSYCESRIRKVESVLKESFQMLSKYLSK